MAIISSKSSPEPKPPKKSDVTSEATAPKPPIPESLVREPQDATAQETASVAVPVEDGLRPQKLAEYIGQKSLKEVLDIAIRAAQSRKEPLDHLLLYGPPGLGKTTMALILAQEMQVDCKITTAPALERPRDIAGLLVNLKPGDILFIDEIHRLPRVTEEILYPAMEDSRLDITIGNVGDQGLAIFAKEMMNVSAGPVCWHGRSLHQGGNQVALGRPKLHWAIGVSSRHFSKQGLAIGTVSKLDINVVGFVVYRRFVHQRCQLMTLSIPKHDRPKR